MRQVEYDYVLKSIRIIEPGNIRGSGLGDLIGDLKSYEYPNQEFVDYVLQM